MGSLRTEIRQFLQSWGFLPSDNYLENRAELRREAVEHQIHLQNSPVPSPPKEPEDPRDILCALLIQRIQANPCLVETVFLKDREKYESGIREYYAHKCIFSTYYEIKIENELEISAIFQKYKLEYCSVVEASADKFKASNPETKERFELEPKHWDKIAEALHDSYVFKLSLEQEKQLAKKKQKALNQIEKLTLTPLLLSFEPSQQETTDEYTHDN